VREAESGPAIIARPVPIYEYRCNNGHTFEVIQRMSDPPVAVCQECGAPVERVFHPVAVHFKGSGFYTTDYGSKAKARAGAEGGDSKGGDSSGDSGAKKDSDKKGSGSADKPKARSTE
jgi:putative FmdB family regulatory protein